MRAVRRTHASAPRDALGGARVARAHAAGAARSAVHPRRAVGDDGTLDAAARGRVAHQPERAALARRTARRRTRHAGAVGALVGRRAVDVGEAIDAVPVRRVADLPGARPRRRAHHRHDAASAETDLPAVAAVARRATLDAGAPYAVAHEPHPGAIPVRDAARRDRVTRGDIERCVGRQRIRRSGVGRGVDRLRVDRSGVDRHAVERAGGVDRHRRFGARRKQHGGQEATERALHKTCSPFFEPKRGAWVGAPHVRPSRSCDVSLCGSRRGRVNAGAPLVLASGAPLILTKT